MAECNACNREMLVAPGCTLETVIVRGEERRRLAFRGGTEKCEGCSAMPEQLHHPECDREICPRCRRRLHTCRCKTVWPDELGQDEEFEDDIPRLRLV